MPTFVSGLPVHVLVVHAVVVLVPLAALGAVLAAVWPAARRRYGWLVVALTAAGALSIPVATSTGEGLRDRLPRSALIARHAYLGGKLLVFVGLLFLAATGLVALDRRTRRAAAGRTGAAATTLARPAGPHRSGHPLVLALSALTVLLAVVSAVQVFRIGDSGARAAWSDTQYVAPGGQGGGG
jgi:hypothetical protein